MKNLLLLAGATALALMPALAFGQSYPGSSIVVPNSMPAHAIYCDDGTGHAAQCAFGKQESFSLAVANTPAAPATTFGGSYILSQACSGYGSLNLQVLGPDGVTWQTVMTKTASDSSGGSAVTLGSFARVRVTVSGTTGCYAILARVPA